MNLQGIAIPFFTESQWIAARTVMEDGMTFHDNYADFVQRVVQAETRLRNQGQATIRVNIEPDTFAQWCRDHGRKINSESRSTYAAMVAAKNDTGR
jgi:hypothetical protein